MPSLLLLLLSASPALSKNYSGTVANVWAHVRRRPELLRAHRVMANIHPEHGGDSERSSRVKIVPTGVEELIARAMNPERLALLVNRTRANYRAGEPFPHAVIDGLFPESLLDRLAAEIPEDQANGTASCAIGTNCFRNPKAEYLKGYIGKLNLMGKVTQTFFSFFRTVQWTRFLEQISGIEPIIADPDEQAVHVTSRGGLLKVHADFNKRFGHRRRVNTFLFLNKRWPDEYGGHLELWNRHMTKCSQRIAPAFGRFVVFSTTDFSYHGHPNPLTAPPGRARRSLALYFYSHLQNTPRHECLRGECIRTFHSTLFKTPKGCEACQEPSCNELPSEPMRFLADTDGHSKQ